jgi:hypothetical protein
MTSFDGGSGNTSGYTSSQASTSSLIGTMYIHYIIVIYVTDPAKEIKQFGLFKFEEDIDITPWNVSYPLNLAPTTSPLPNLKDNLPKLFANGTILVNEHLISFSKAFHNIGANDNDMCVHLLFNCLEEKLLLIFLNYLQKYPLLGMNCLIGLNIHTDMPKV